MNPNRKLFAKLTINGTEYDLKSPPSFGDLMNRLHAQFLAHKAVNNKCSGILEFSFEPIQDSLLSYEQRLEKEIMANAITDLDAVMLEDENGREYTIREVDAVLADPIHDAYRVIADPAKRIGMDQAEITRIKEAYESKYGALGRAVCKWR